MVKVAFWFDAPVEYSGGLNYIKNLLHALSQVNDDSVHPYVFFSNDTPTNIEAQFARYATFARTKLLQRGTASCEHAGLIAQHCSVYPIDRMRVTPLEFGVALGASHEEGAGLVNHKQPRETQITAIHQVERARLQHQIVQHVDLACLAIGNVNETGDVSAQIQERVQLDGSLGLAKRRPRKHRQAKVDGAGSNA
jgi:hypothetical protein